MPVFLNLGSADPIGVREKVFGVRILLGVRKGSAKMLTCTDKVIFEVFVFVDVRTKFLSYQL